MFQDREDRFPSSWPLALSSPAIPRVAAQVSNVSPSGMRFRSTPALTVGDRFAFTLRGTKIHGSVVRVSAQGSGAHFDRLLTEQEIWTLRQYRQLVG